MSEFVWLCVKLHTSGMYIHTIHIYSYFYYTYICTSEWSQEVTEKVPSVKITNMTTSWRSGLGFLAIILYYRPDLVP